MFFFMYAVVAILFRPIRTVSPIFDITREYTLRKIRITVISLLFMEIIKGSEKDEKAVHS